MPLQPEIPNEPQHYFDGLSASRPCPQDCFPASENSHIVLPRICMKYQNIFCRLRISNNVCITVWGRSQACDRQAESDLAAYFNSMQLKLVTPDGGVNGVVNRCQAVTSNVRPHHPQHHNNYHNSYAHPCAPTVAWNTTHTHAPTVAWNSGTHRASDSGSLAG